MAVMADYPYTAEFDSVVSGKKYSPYYCKWTIKFL
jgi:hypothetical protein